ncbi:MAG: HAMP domain-containing sensor histidine kinase [Methylococcaceae bacterium]
MNNFLSRPAKFRAMAFLGLLLMALTILGGMVFRNFHHFHTVLLYVDYSHRIQSVCVGLQQSLIGHLLQKTPEANSADLSKTLAEIDGLIIDNQYLSATTRSNLETVRTIIKNFGLLNAQEKNTNLTTALNIISSTLNQETLQRETLLEEIGITTQSELHVTLFIFAIISLSALFFLYFRILHPLNDLRRLLERLTEENFTPINTDHLDPLLLPVFNSYNEMVRHLAELEDTKRLYAQSLQREVRLATQALLEQHHSLARAERLAAIGEVTAELAHEIRNPLAGIQMAFNNLRKEIIDDNQTERIDSIGAELKRLAKLLSDMLNQTRHTPENTTDFDAVALVKDLVSLTRYQVAEPIQISIDAPVALFVHLPESGLRQVLLNLVLNAAEILDGRKGLIAISVRADAQGLYFKVTDSGPGFPQEMLDYGIRPFRTSHSRGTGLGLAMVQRFVKNIGGVIKLANLRPQGASVTLSLPKECLIGEHG